MSQRKIISLSSLDAIIMLITSERSSGCFRSLFPNMRGLRCKSLVISHLLLFFWASKDLLTTRKQAGAGLSGLCLVGNSVERDRGREMFSISKS